jgi:hypothetical protein
MWVPVGLITVPTPGTPVQLSANFFNTDVWPGPLTDTTCRVHGVMVQANPRGTNAGPLYLGVEGLTKATLVNCLHVLPLLANGVPYTVTASLTLAAAAIALNNLYLDADEVDDEALVSVLVL